MTKFVKDVKMITALTVMKLDIKAFVKNVIIILKLSILNVSFNVIKIVYKTIAQTVFVKSVIGTMELKMALVLNAKIKNVKYVWMTILNVWYVKNFIIRKINLVL